MVALANLHEGDIVTYDGEAYTIIGNVLAKHKFFVKGYETRRRGGLCMVCW